LEKLPFILKEKLKEYISNAIDAQFFGKSL